MGNKKCNNCLDIKEISEFRTGKSICKECERAKNRKRYYEKNYYYNKKNKTYGFFVYRLKKNYRIVYVGRTESLIFRMEQHIRDKEFNKIEILYFDNKIDMKIAELYFISKYKPILNKKDKYDDISMTIEELDKLEWKEIKYEELLNIEDFIKKDTFTNGIISKDGTKIPFKEIKSCFARQRTNKYLVYVELLNKKQKLIESFKDRESALELVQEIKKDKESIINSFE